jgi:hypothetical protein
VDQQDPDARRRLRHHDIANQPQPVERTELDA